MCSNVFIKMDSWKEWFCCLCTSQVLVLSSGFYFTSSQDITSEKCLKKIYDFLENCGFFHYCCGTVRNCILCCHFSHCTNSSIIGMNVISKNAYNVNAVPFESLASQLDYVL